MIAVSVQLSVYPLRQPELSPTIDATLEICRAHGLDVRPGAMSTVLTGDDEQIFAALKQAFRAAAVRGDVVMVATLSNACPAEAACDSPV